MGPLRARKAYVRPRNVTGIGLGHGASADAGLAAWSPSSTPGLVAWFDAGAGITKDGSNNVTAWADVSGNGYVLSNVLGNQPVYSATGWNGTLPSLTHSSANWLACATAPLSTLSNGILQTWSVLATCQATSNTNYRVIGAWDDTLGNQTYSFGVDPSHHIYNNDGTIIASGSNTIDGVRAVMAWVTGGGTTSMWVNGTLEVNAIALGNVFTSANRFLYALHPLGSFGWAGTISEILVYSTKLTSTDVANYRTFAQAKWGGL